jgi:S-adenosylmethionine decarboxylase proenzyme
MNTPVGKHLILELYHCNPELLKNTSVAERIMLDAAQEIGATVVQYNFHQFSPFGVSGVVVIQESHLTIHTWPEHGYAAIDIFTCGEKINPVHAVSFLKKKFEAENFSVMEIRRGNPDFLT